MYLEALFSNFVFESQITGIPASSVPSIRNDRGNNLGRELMVPAGVIVEVEASQGRDLLKRGRATGRPKWQDVTREVAAGLKSRSPLDGEAEPTTEATETETDPMAKVFGTDLADMLRRARYESLEDVAGAEASHLGTVPGVSDPESVIEKAQEALPKDFEDVMGEFAPDLRDVGLETFEKVANAEPAALEEIAGVGPATAQKLIDSARAAAA